MPICNEMSMSTPTLDGAGMLSLPIPVDRVAVISGEHFKRSCDGAVAAFAFSPGEIEGFSDRTTTLDL